MKLLLAIASVFLIVSCASKEHEHGYHAHHPDAEDHQDHAAADDHHHSHHDAHHHGHSHTRDKMMLTDAGNYHALLTAHLAKAGNELDIFIETAEKSPKPKAVPYTNFKAKASSGAGQHELKFNCAPAEERPEGEKKGTCSRFVANAPWMKRDDTIAVGATLKLDKKLESVQWHHFNPLKYAHHIE